MICRSQRSAKSAAWSKENVVGVSSRLCFPRRVADFTSGEEFHSVKCSRYPPISSQRFSKYNCVLLPEPSVPSTTISAPGYARLGTGRPGCGKVDLAASGRGAFCIDSGFSIVPVGTNGSVSRPYLEFVTTALQHSGTGRRKAAKGALQRAAHFARWFVRKW